jgi:hypothetical protein
MREKPMMWLGPSAPSVFSLREALYPTGGRMTLISIDKEGTPTTFGSLNAGDFFFFNEDLRVKLTRAYCWSIVYREQQEHSDSTEVEFVRKVDISCGTSE